MHKMLPKYNSKQVSYFNLTTLYFQDNFKIQDPNKVLKHFIIFKIQGSEFDNIKLYNNFQIQIKSPNFKNPNIIKLRIQIIVSKYSILFLTNVISIYIYVLYRNKLYNFKQDYILTLTFSHLHYTFPCRLNMGLAQKKLLTTF